MGKYVLENLDGVKLSEIRHNWPLELQDDDEIIKIQTFIDAINASNAYGDALSRPNLSTHMAVVDHDNNGEVEALVEIINAEMGKERICKIMDFVYSPRIEAMADNEYMVSRLSMLMASLFYVIRAVNMRGAGHCKIYARDDAGQNIIASIEEALQNKEEELGLKVELNGRKWLKFEPL